MIDKFDIIILLKQLHSDVKNARKTKFLKIHDTDSIFVNLNII